MFWIKKGDPYERAAPEEAVDPLTVSPGKLGLHPQCLNGPEHPLPTPREGTTA